MTHEDQQRLLTCADLPSFLTALRLTLPGDRRSRQRVVDMIRPYGGPNSRQAILQYENGISGLNSRVQLAYARGFRLSKPLRLHLQKLAGEHAGAPVLETKPSAAA